MMHALAVVLLVAGGKPQGAKDAGVPLGEQVPLEVLVKSPEELGYKAVTERQYLLVTLLVGAKASWDRQAWDDAATKWEAALRLPGLSAEVESAVRPFATAARERAGGKASSVPQLAASPEANPTSVTITMEPPELKEKKQLIEVSGVVQGGGSHGPGGAVVIFRRASGSTPKPKAARVRAVLQKDKRFVPHVLAVPLGATVEFRNDDDFFHNVFSISKPNDFDLGLYKSGAQREQVFNTPGRCSCSATSTRR